MLARGQVLLAMHALGSQFLSAFLLAPGICVSMVRTERRGAKALPAGAVARCARIFGVWTFFSLIVIREAKCGAAFSTRTRFILGLFGLA